MLPLYFFMYFTSNREGVFSINVWDYEAALLSFSIFAGSPRSLVEGPLFVFSGFGHPNIKLIQHTDLGHIVTT